MCPGCAIRPWEDGTDSVEMAIKRVRVAFEFIDKLGAPFYCFHDRDVAPEGANLRETNANLDKVAKVLKEEQQRTGIKLLWGTANLFSNKRFVHGAATSCNADVFAYAAAQVKKAIEVTHDLGEAAFFAHRIALLHEGRIAQEGTFEELARAPADPYVARFIHAQRAPLERLR